MTAPHLTRTTALASNVSHLGPAAGTHEAARLAALEEYGLIETAPTPEFDQICHTAALVCGTPMAAISFTDSRTEWFMSEVGLNRTSLPLDSSISPQAIGDGGLVLVRDLREDPRFARHPLVVNEPGLRFYAGAPLTTPDGNVLGMLSVLDRVPRELDSSHEMVLRAFAEQVMARLELRRRLKSAERMVAALVSAMDRGEWRAATAVEPAAMAPDEMFGLIAHELQNPLMLIDWTARLLRRDDALAGAERNLALDAMAASSARMGRLVKNMAVLAREGSEFHLEGEPLVLRPRFDATLAEHELMHPDTRVEILAEPGLPPVTGDATSIDQILTNLLSNATKYGARGEPIWLTAERRGGSVLVSVTNRGDPVSAETIEHLFEPYFRARTHRQRVPGTGLGLAVCRRLVEAQGGTIWARARSRGGLRVCFTLPVAEAC